MPLFTPLQLPKLIELAKKNRIAPIYIFIGPYEFTIEKAKEICNLFLERGSQIEIYNLQDSEKKKEFLKIKGFQEGLFGQRTFYLIIGGEEIPPSKVEEIFYRLKENPQNFSWIILFKDLQEKHLLYQLALEKGAIIPYHSKKKTDLLETELLMLLKENQLTMDKKTANLFLSLVGEDYNHFKRELEKLILYCLENKVITEEKVLEIIVPFEEKTLYLIMDFLWEKGPASTLQLIQHFLDTEKEQGPGKLLVYFYKYFKTLKLLNEILKTRPELERVGYYPEFSKLWEELKKDSLIELPKLLEQTHPYVIFKMKRQLKEFPSIDQLLIELFEAEWRLKYEFWDPLKVFQDLVFKLWSQKFLKKDGDTPLVQPLL